MSKKQKNPGPAVVKDSPSDVARVMRKEAVKNAGKEPSFRVYRGWMFGLSYGPPPVPTKEAWGKLAALPGGIAGLIARFGFKEIPADLSYEGFYERLEGAKSAGGDASKRNEWIFSASLHPRGRSSVEGDWRFYGEMAAMIGAPAESLITPIETTDPNAVHYHIWRGDPAESDKAKAN